VTRCSGFACRLQAAMMPTTREQHSRMMRWPNDVLLLLGRWQVSEKMYYMNEKETRGYMLPYNGSLLYMNEVDDNRSNHMNTPQRSSMHNGNAMQWLDKVYTVM